jgi:hypothetical protein
MMLDDNASSSDTDAEESEEDCCSKSCSCADNDATSSKSCSCADDDAATSAAADATDDTASSMSHLELENYASDDEPDSEGETLYSVMDDLKKQVATLHAASGGVAGQMASLYERAKLEEVQWYDEPLEIRAAPVRTWAAKKKLPANPTLRDFLDTCFDSAISLDLETRVLHFTKEDAAALWGGQRRITIFEVIGLLPTLFL